MKMSSGLTYRSRKGGSMYRARIWFDVCRYSQTPESVAELLNFFGYQGDGFFATFS